MNAHEAQAMMQLARAAQSSWAGLTVSRRCVFMGNLRRLIASECDSISSIIARETSKPLLDALSGDVLVTLEAIRYYEARAAKILRRRKVGKSPFFFIGARFEQCYEPHGVALIFGPSNYPLQLCLIPLITALVAGNAVVLKCSEHTSETGELISKLCKEAGFPRNLVQVVTEAPENSSFLIDAHPDLIFFTGSCRNGQLVATQAARNLIPTILELGGKDASLVFADCHLERAVEGIVYGAFVNGGRVCVGVKRLFIERPIFDKFVAMLVRRIADLRVGLGDDTDFCPSIIHKQSLLFSQIEDAILRGATLLHPKDRSAIEAAPVLLSDVPPDARILTEETFGPVLCIAPFAEESEAIALANTSVFALSSSVWTGDRRRARRVSQQVSAGSCGVNDVIRVIANPHAAFGGNGQSGYGRYHGPEGLRAFSRIKTVMFARDRRANEINWFPFTCRKRKQLSSLIRAFYGGTGIVARLSRILFSIFLSTILVIPLPAQGKPEAHLTIDVRLASNARGEVGYLIFASPEGFPGDRSKAIRHGFLKIPINASELHIDANLPSGTYAVSVYEDLNGNHKLDHNLIGIPKEPVGASNNPHVKMRAPRFDECSFLIDAEPKTVTINLVGGL